MKVQLMARHYDLDVTDPIELVARYDVKIKDGGGIMDPASKDHADGLTITAHGCEGCVWLQWEDVPALIAGIQKALDDSKEVEG